MGNSAVAVKVGLAGCCRTSLDVFGFNLLYVLSVGCSVGNGHFFHITPADYKPLV